MNNPTVKTHRMSRRWRTRVKTPRWPSRGQRTSLLPGCDDASDFEQEAPVRIMDENELHETECGSCQALAGSFPSEQTLPFDECSIAQSRKTAPKSESASEE